MNKIKNLFFSISFILFALLISCDHQPTEFTNANIASFYFNYHENVDGIEDVIFTVDTTLLTIKNSDSLNYNLNLTKLLPVITFYEEPYDIYINDELWNQTDSIDFSNNITIKVISGNTLNERIYTTEIISHKVNPDEIKWNQHPNINIAAKSLQLLELNNKLYLFISTDTEKCILYTSNNGSDWAQETINNTFDINIRSIAKFNDSFYACATDGSSTYNFDLSSNTWNEIGGYTDAVFTDIIGQRADLLYGIVRHSDMSKVVVYDGSSWQIKTDIPDNNFPIKSEAKIIDNNRFYLLGGLNNDNTTLYNVYTCMDGQYWTYILNNGGSDYNFGYRKDAAAISYFGYFYIFGGMNENSHEVGDIFHSPNSGFSWSKVPSYQKLPSTFEPCSMQTVVEHNKNLILTGISNDNGYIQVWSGRINKADFLIQ